MPWFAFIYLQLFVDWMAVIAKNHSYYKYLSVSTVCTLWLVIFAGCILLYSPLNLIIPFPTCPIILLTSFSQSVCTVSYGYGLVFFSLIYGLCTLHLGHKSIGKKTWSVPWTQVVIKEVFPHSVNARLIQVPPWTHFGQFLPLLSLWIKS